MQRKLLIKFLVIGGLILFLLIPLELIESLVEERSSYREAAKKDIALSWTGAQEIIGPILTIPYKRKVKQRVWDKEIKQYVDQMIYTEEHVYFLPEVLLINGKAVLQERYRGIYKVSVYTSDLSINGQFALPKAFGIDATKSEILWGQAYLSVGIQDSRGIKTEPKLSWKGGTKEFLPGTNVRFLNEGVHAVVGKLKRDKAYNYHFSFNLNLRGMGSIAFSPVGKTTTVKLESSWPHPSFTGRFLPERRNISDEGFSAIWETSYFSSNMQQLFDRCIETNCKAFNQNLIGVSFIQPVDIYQQTDRSIKYAILFVLLTFVVFVLFEVLKKLPIHPVQYCLVGLALAIFYLLLISLSEHMIFTVAYCLASVACIALLTFYVSFVLKDRIRGLGFGCLLVLLYGVLYTLIRSEDHALLMGSLLLFVTLSLIMYFTCGIDWYQAADTVTQQDQAEPAAGGKF